jgi:RNAse (barnase) inhibitor barstar
MIIDLGNIGSVQELHLKLKTELDFPDNYGMNWESFWECITASSTLPEEIILRNWKSLEHTLSSDAERLKEMIMEYNRSDLDTEIAIEQVY